MPRNSSRLEAVATIGIDIGTHASMPMRQGGMFASRASTWRRESF
jgi:hypothetical protein